MKLLVNQVQKQTHRRIQQRIIDSCGAVKILSNCHHHPLFGRNWECNAVLIRDYMDKLLFTRTSYEALSDVVAFIYRSQCELYGECSMNSQMARIKDKSGGGFFLMRFQCERLDHNDLVLSYGTKESEVVQQPELLIIS